MPIPPSVPPICSFDILDLPAGIWQLCKEAEQSYHATSSGPAYGATFVPFINHNFWYGLDLASARAECVRRTITQLVPNPELHGGNFCGVSSRHQSKRVNRR